MGREQMTPEELDAIAEAATLRGGLGYWPDAAEEWRDEVRRTLVFAFAAREGRNAARAAARAAPSAERLALLARAENAEAATREALRLLRESEARCERLASAAAPPVPPDDLPAVPEWLREYAKHPHPAHPAPRTHAVAQLLIATIDALRARDTR